MVELRGSHNPRRFQKIPERILIDNDADVLSEHFSLPEISASVGGSSSTSTTVEWQRTSVDLRCEIKKDRTLADKRSVDKGAPYAQPLSLKVTGTEHGVPEDDVFGHLFRFSGFFQENADGSSAWQMNYRMVEGMYRGKGFGELAGRAWVECVQRIGEEHPEFKGQCIEIPTALAAVMRLFLSREWLKKNGLEEFSRNTTYDFGFEPVGAEPATIRRILEKGYNAIAQEKDDEPEVVLRRPIV